MNIIQNNKFRNNFFTLIELMIVFGIILILAAMLLPALMKSKNTAQATYCKNNLKQLGTSNLMYASEWERFVAFAPDKTDTYEGLARWHGKRSVVSNTAVYDVEKGALYDYMKGKDITNCPEFAKHVDTESPSEELGGGGYGYNIYLGTNSYFVDDPDSEESYKSGILIKQLHEPTGTVMFTDSAMNVDSAGNIESTSSAGVVAPYSIAVAPFPVNNKVAVILPGANENSPSIHFLHDRSTNVVWADGHVSSQRFKWTLDSGWKAKFLGFFGSQNDNSYFDPH